MALEGEIYNKVREIINSYLNHGTFGLSALKTLIDGVRGVVDTTATRIPGTIQPQTGDSFARLGAPVGASIAADIAGAKSSADTAASNASTASSNASSANTAASGAKSNTDHLPARIPSGGIGPGIRSIQRGTGMIQWTQTSKAFTLGTTLADAGKAVVVNLSYRFQNNTYGVMAFPRLEGLTTTQITFGCNAIDCDVYIAWEIIEYY